MRFYLLKRYSESFIRHLPVGMIILDTHENVQLVNFAGIEALDLPGDVRANHLERWQLVRRLQCVRILLRRQNVRRKGEIEKISDQGLGGKIRYRDR